MALPEESTGQQPSHKQEMAGEASIPEHAALKTPTYRLDIKVTEQHEWLHVQTLKVQWDSHSGVRGERIWQVK